MALGGGREGSFEVELRCLVHFFVIKLIYIVM